MSSTQPITLSGSGEWKLRPNPFHGLRRFEIEDASLFFGRDEQTYEVLRRLRLLHFVAVLGPSGCGKSSLIRAGVLSALQAGYMADEGPWRLVALQPGNGPLESWKRHLRPHLREGAVEEDLLTQPARALNTDSGRIAILVDQFEELFQYSARTGRDRDVRLFLQAMLSCASGRDSRIHLIITMRTEYLAQCASYASLAESINEGIYLVPEMSRDQMSQAIVGPIRKVSAEITAPLLDRLLNDAAGQPDALPVLQHALMRMWSKKRPWEPLGLPEYERQIADLAATASADAAHEAGIASFIAGHANEVLARLDPDGQAAARRLFQVLTELTSDGRAVRHANTVADLVGATGLSPEVVAAVIEAYRREGFLNVWESESSHSPLVDITHEAVARQWDTLRGWMLEEARARRNLQRVAEAAREWAEHGRNRAYLFSGLKLAEAQTYLRGREHELDAASRAFLAASATGQTLNRLLSPTVMAAAAVLLAILSGLTWLSVNRAKAATRQSELANRQNKLATEQMNRALAAEAQARAALESAQAAYSRLNQVAPAVAAIPRIFFQIRNANQRNDAQVLAGQLRKAGFEVPGIQNVASGPDITEVRYFRSSDEANARQIVKLLADRSVPAKPVLVQAYGQPDTRFELWLAPAAAVQPVTAQPADASIAAPVPPVSQPQPRTVSESQPAKPGEPPATETAPATTVRCPVPPVSFNPPSGEFQKIEFRVEKTCPGDGSPVWKMHLAYWEKDPSGGPTGSTDFTHHGNDPKADATAAGGLDAAQQKQALLATSVLRAFLDHRATSNQLSIAIRDIISVRSDGGAKQE